MVVAYSRIPDLLIIAKAYIGDFYQKNLNHFDTAFLKKKRCSAMHRFLKNEPFQRGFLASGIGGEHLWNLACVV